MDLYNYINEWEKDYHTKIKQLDLFNTDTANFWIPDQKKKFAEVFYHLRGHFHDFLWYLGSTAEDAESKQIILENIQEEFNGTAKSHEQMYYIFANEVGADVSKEFFQKKHYGCLAKEFNLGHMEWLGNHDAKECFAAFAAYERLDNIDYPYLLELVQALGISKKGQIFFKIHAHVEHFKSTTPKLEQIWHENPQKVKESFTFIAYHQLNMWNMLWKEISST